MPSPKPSARAARPKPAEPPARPTLIGTTIPGEHALDICDLCHCEVHAHVPGCPREQAAAMLADDPTLALPDPPEPPRLIDAARGFVGALLIRVGEGLGGRKPPSDAL